jgi:predicted lipase
VGIITGADDIAKTGNSLRQQFMTSGNDRRRYGYLAVNKNDPTRYVAVIRGTDGAEEWIDDFDFFATQRPQFPGNVESGFVDIYQSMQYFPIADPGNIQPLADGIATALNPVPGATVTVVGHSLGSALATYLTYDLSVPGRLGSANVSAILFASPKTGDNGFVSGFNQLNSNYLVINYQHDVVPTVPPFDIFHLDLFRTLPNCRILLDANACAKINSDDPGCCHHLICYIAMLSQTVYIGSRPGWTNDEITCAKCVL